jgi:hypothetical protein
MSTSAERIAALRAFNRLSLAEARLLWELAHADTTPPPSWRACSSSTPAI